MIPTFSSFSEDGDFSDFFNPTNAFIHFPETPMLQAKIASVETELQENSLWKIKTKLIEYKSN